MKVDYVDPVNRPIPGQVVKQHLGRVDHYKLQQEKISACKPGQETVVPVNQGRVQDTGYRIQDTGYRIQDTGYRNSLREII